MSQSPYDAAGLLANLRREVCFRTYGLVVQALFAHTLMKLGGVVLEIKNPGHPDIRMILGGLRYNIEVETASRKTLPRQLERGRRSRLVLLVLGRGFQVLRDCKIDEEVW